MVNLLLLPGLSFGLEKNLTEAQANQGGVGLPAGESTGAQKSSGNLRFQPPEKPYPQEVMTS